MIFYNQFSVTIYYGQNCYLIILAKVENILQERIWKRIKDLGDGGKENCSFWH